MSNIPFIDLKAQRERLGTRIDDAIARVLDHGGFIMGPEVREFEEKLAAFSDTKHAIGCANGTDALQLVLMAKGVGAGDAVFVPSFTFAATAETVALVGATPVFVDILPGTFNMDPQNLEAAIEGIKGSDLNPVAVMPVDLFGQPADYTAINEIARNHGLFVIADAAQSCGATLGGKTVGSLAEVTTTSFFPAKPLGCYGDGGAVLTDDDAMADAMRSIRVHGKGTEKYDNVVIGLNSRLDTLQAAILLEKLAIFPDEITARQKIADRYSEALAGVAEVPEVTGGMTSVWAQYTLKVEGRDELAAALKAQGVPSAIYYPKPLHRQTAYKDFPVSSGGMSVSENMSARVLSLPMHPYLDEATQDRIIQSVQKAIKA